MQNEFLLARLRLGGSGRSSDREGWIEGCGTNGKWGGICDDDFDINDAHVICRELGFPSAITALRNSLANFMYGSAPSYNSFVLSHLNCTGNETSVFDCPHGGEWNEHCNANEIAGVQCAASEPIKTFFSFAEKIIFTVNASIIAIEGL